MSGGVNMDTDKYRTAVLSQFGAEALARLEVVTCESGHTPLGWGVVCKDGDSASGTYRMSITVDPRYVVFIGGEWQTPRWFSPKGQNWAREVLGDFS
jgi:hypothetical protein